jgi:hypothetical protein
MLKWMGQVHLNQSESIKLEQPQSKEAYDIRLTTSIASDKPAAVESVAGTSIPEQSKEPSS